MRKIGSHLAFLIMFVALSSINNSEVEYRYLQDSVALIILRVLCFWKQPYMGYFWPQLPNVWEDELNNVVQMSFGASRTSPDDNQDVDGISILSDFTKEIFYFLFFFYFKVCY